MLIRNEKQDFCVFFEVNMSQLDHLRYEQSINRQSHILCIENTEKRVTPMVGDDAFLAEVLNYGAG